MTGGGATVTVPVQWALQGKARDDRGFRVLACSTGDISEGNFTEILDRFAPGTLDWLPQVTVSYVSVKDRPGYLSMAFHEEAGGLDRLGRDVTSTRLFCMPYQQLAAGQVSYRAMYERFERLRLPGASEPPFPVELSRPGGTIPGDAARALPVVELLLTGNPVCIVDAGSTSVSERLVYIDTVMSLLPYGLRAEMAAATWTSSTYRGHRFRLFFSEAPRRAAESGRDDHLVRWRTDQMVIDRVAEPLVPAYFGAEYREWLQKVLDTPSVASELALDATARAFKAEDIDQILEGIPAKEHKRLWSRPSKRRETPVRRDEAPVFGSRPGARPLQLPAKPAAHDFIDSRLDEIARRLSGPAADPKSALDYLDALRADLSNARPTDESRKRYRARIAACGLLREDIPVSAGKKVNFYRVLLRTAFGDTIGYLEYLEVENMLQELQEKVSEKLLQAIDEMLGAGSPIDSRALFVVRSYLKAKNLKSEFGPARLLKMAADRELSADHASLIWGATTEALRAARPAEMARDILPELQRRGFLAVELQERDPTDLESQVDALVDLLRAVFRTDRLDPVAFPVVFSGFDGHYPTLALFLAVCHFTDSADFGFMCTSFLVGLGGSREVPSSARSHLDRLGFSGGPETIFEEDMSYVPADGVPTQPAMPLSRTAAVELYSNLQPADQPKRGFIRKLLNPSGDFSVYNAKAQEKNER